MWRWTKSYAMGTVELNAYIINDFDLGDKKVVVSLESSVESDSQSFG